MEYRLDSLPEVPRLVNRLRLKHWALLAALADRPTLAQAATTVSVTQSSATKMLADIEQAFQFPLFERHPRGLRPTPMGQEVLAYAHRSQADLARFLEELEAKRRGGHGLLAIGAIMGAAPDVVAHAVAALKRERPLLNIRLTGETNDQIVMLLQQHEIELAVGRFSASPQHNTLAFEPLAKEIMQVVVRRGHPLLQQPTLMLQELAAWPWVLQPLTSPSRQLVEDEFALARMGTPANLVECASVITILQLLQTSDSVGALPESVLRDHVKARLLCPLPVPIREDLRGFGVLTRVGETLSEPAAALAAQLRHFAALCAAVAAQGGEQ